MPSLPPPEHPFVNAASEFCGLIDQMDILDRKLWLSRMGSSLLKLEKSIADLPALNGHSNARIGLADLDKRFDLYARLKAFLKEFDEYWSEADLLAADGFMTGSLSDDFADLYFELKRGLVLYEQGGESTVGAIQLWLASYRDHWRQHLVDARKQLIDFGRAKKRLSRSN